MLKARANGFLNPGLSLEGQEQAQRLRDRLIFTGEIQAEVLISSTLQRARETAEIIAPVWGLPIVYEDGICEWNNEDSPTAYENFVTRLKTTPHDQRTFVAPSPACESWAAFQFRAFTALNQIVTMYEGKRIVVVCHGGIIEAAFLLFSGLGISRFTPIILASDYTSLTVWRRVKGELLPDRWMLERFNDSAHLVNFDRKTMT